MSVTARGFVTTANVSRVASSATNVTLIPANGNRQQVIVFNESTSVMFIKYGATASATSYTAQVAAGGYWEMPKPLYRGQIDAYWTTANGAAQVTEGV